MEITEVIKKIRPATLARVRGKRQEASTRDKNRLLKKAKEIDCILEKLGYKIFIENCG